MNDQNQLLSMINENFLTIKIRKYSNDEIKDIRNFLSLVYQFITQNSQNPKEMKLAKNQLNFLFFKIQEQSSINCLDTIFKRQYKLEKVVYDYDLFAKNCLNFKIQKTSDVTEFDKTLLFLIDDLFTFFKDITHKNKDEKIMNGITYILNVHIFNYLVINQDHFNFESKKDFKNEIYKKLQEYSQDNRPACKQLATKYLDLLFKEQVGDEKCAELLKNFTL